MPRDAQERLFQNTARAIGGVDTFIQQRHIFHCTKADEAYGKGVASAFGLDWEAACASACKEMAVPGAVAPSQPMLLTSKPCVQMENGADQKQKSWWSGLLACQQKPGHGMN